MESSINERIKLLLKELNYKSNRAFALKIGISQTSFNDIIKGAEPKFSTLEKIIIAEPFINSEWLLTGKGEMLKHENFSVDKTDNPVSESEEVKRLSIQNERIVKRSFERNEKNTDIIIEKDNEIKQLNSEKELLYKEMLKIKDEYNVLSIENTQLKFNLGFAKRG
jgi:hypothetical protein